MDNNNYETNNTNNTNTSSQAGYNPYQQAAPQYNSQYSQNQYGSQNGYSTQSGYSSQSAYGSQQYGSQNQYSQNQYTRTYTSPSQPPKKDKKNGGFGSFVGKTVAAALIFGLVGGSVFTGVSYVGTKSLGIESTAKVESSKADLSVNKADSNMEKTSTGSAKDLTDVSAIVNEVMPSIVAITNTATIKYQSFWGMQENREATSCGSGFIVNKDDKYLYIATNNHVVADADSLTVQFADDETVDAQVRGTDPSDDLAVVMVAIEDIPEDTLKAIKVATIGDSDAVTVGSASIAIGNALGYGQSVTTGVISALNRSVTTQDEYTGEVVTNSNLLQTDAAINPGNSGGALLNANGEVIGINSVKYASTEVEGIGYAIPMAYAKPILESLIDNGKYVDTQTAYLGIKGGDVSEDMTAYGFPNGVYITNVFVGSGADKAGLQQGDIITKIDGKKISGMEDLQGILKTHKAGDTIKVNVSRQQGQGFEELKLELVLSSEADLTE